MDISAWLRDLGLERYEQAFRDNAVGPDVLAKLTAEDLKDIGVTAVGDRRRLLEAITALTAQSRAKGNIAEPSDEPAEAERRQLTVVFGDLVGFTTYCELHSAEEVLANLDRLAFDLEQIAARHGLEKIKTIGDAFMVTANLLEPHPDPVMAGVRFAFEMVEAARRNPAGWQVRLGIHVGSVIAGVIGRSKFSFDLWGDTVNTAARLSDLGVEGGVYLTGAAWQRVQGRCPGRCLGRVSL